LQSAVAFAFAVAVAVALALALLVVIPEGDLLLLSPLPVLLPNQKLCHPALSVVEWVLTAFVSNAVERSAVVLAGRASSCCHPARSEGSRRTPQAKTVRTFQPVPFSGEIRFSTQPKTL
jgi:hypothetical protein